MQSEQPLGERNDTVGFVVLHFLVLLFIVVFTVRTAAHLHASDLHVYFDYAQRVLGGEWPYRDFSMEYPPLALLPIALPQLVTLGSLSYTGYVWFFSVQNVVLSLLVALALVQVAAHWRPKRHPASMAKA